MEMYAIKMNEIMAEQVMLEVEAAEGSQAIVDKFAEVVPVIPGDCGDVEVILTADEMYEVFNTYINITGGR